MSEPLIASCKSGSDVGLRDENEERSLWDKASWAPGCSIVSNDVQASDVFEAFVLSQSRSVCSDARKQVRPNRSLCATIGKV